MMNSLMRYKNFTGQWRLLLRFIAVLLIVATLSACEFCITTQCRGRPFLPSQKSQVSETAYVGVSLANPNIFKHPLLIQ
jgi:hypothetical protein